MTDESRIKEAAELLGVDVDRVRRMMRNETMPRLLSVREVAGILGVKTETVRRMVRNKLITCRRVGMPPIAGPDRRPIRFAPEDVQSYVDETCLLEAESIEGLT